MRKERHIKPAAGIILVLFLVLACPWPTVYARPAAPFRGVRLESPFDVLLTNDPDFMQQGGARAMVFDGGLALLGIAKVFPDKDGRDSEGELLRIGEIRARAAILALGGNVEISSARGADQGFDTVTRTSLSAFFQVTATEVRGKIDQMPVIGTWWSRDRETLYVAVGALKGIPGSENNDFFSTEPAVNNIRFLEGKEPFMSLIQALPVLRQAGGVRGFRFPVGGRAIIAVGLARIGNSRESAMKVARLKAIRALLGSESGIVLSSVEYLGDREILHLTEQREQHVLLTDFLSLQKEAVEGTTRALPVVAVWEDNDGRQIYVAIGEILKT